MKFITMAAVFVVLGLSACTSPASKRASAVAASASYLNDALSQPMQTLYDKALTGDAYDKLRLGLAMTARRPSPAIVRDADRRALDAIDIRLRAAKQVWLKQNSPDTVNKVPWDYQIGLTADDAAVIWRVEQATSADYWLSSAENTTTVQVETFPVPPFTKTGGGGTRAIVTQVPEIDRNILLSAAACAVSVRDHAGLPASLPTPEVIHRLRGSDIRDIVADVASEATQPGYNGDHAVGSAACGTAATFAHYVSLLKLASP